MTHGLSQGIHTSELRIALYGEDNKRTAHNLDFIISSLKEKIAPAGQRIINIQPIKGKPAVYALDYI